MFCVTLNIVRKKDNYIPYTTFGECESYTLSVFKILSLKEYLGMREYSLCF
jgi:hypothetical protein